MHTIILPAEENVTGTQGTLSFIGNATLLIRYAGFTILTDPNFLHQGEHVHLGYGLRSKRLTNPAMDFKDVPPFDLVLLSHLHEDHFDRQVERKLNKASLIITTPQAATALQKKKFFHVEPLPTWSTVTLEKGAYQVQITSLPGRHGPGVLHTLLPEVMGSMLDFCTHTGELLTRIYISGDTLMHDQLHLIPQRYPNVDLGLFHLGGTKVLGVLVTMNAEQGVAAIKLIKPHTAIPIHYEEYTVMKSPLKDFIQCVAEAGLTDQVKVLEHGETYTFDMPASS